MSEINNKELIDKISYLLEDILKIWINNGKFKMEYDFLKYLEIKRRNPIVDLLNKPTASEYTIIIKLDDYSIDLRKMDETLPIVSLNLIIELLDTTLELFKRYVFYKKIINDIKIQKVISNIKQE